MSNKKTGNYGESLACEFLEGLGYRILSRNYLIRGGEVDIIAQDQEFLVFIEVKTRYSHDFGLPIDSITSQKIRFILKSAQFYIQKVRWGDKPYRLDAVLVDFAKNRDNPSIELIKNITF